MADFEEARERRRIAAAGAGVSQFEPHYEGSPIVIGPSGGPGAVGGHTFQPGAGHHLPPPHGSGADLFPRLGADFTLISPSGSSADAFSNTAGELGVPLDVLRDDV